MKRLVTVAIVALSLGLAGTVGAVQPHTITWIPKNAAPGQVVTIAGQQFVLVRFPIRDLASTRRFQVSYLATKNGTAIVPAILTTVHSKDPIVNSIEIDGFDASVFVSDGRTYSLLSNFLTPADDYTFSVNATASCSVSVKLGETLVTLIGHFSVVQHVAENIGTTPNAVPFANWADYVHPNPQITACNNWLDYVRIREL